MSSRLDNQRTCDTVMSVMRQIALLAVVFLSNCCATILDGASNDLVYNNHFAVNIPNASETLVQLIAEKHGFRSLGQVFSSSPHAWKQKPGHNFLHINQSSSRGKS